MQHYLVSRYAPTEPTPTEQLIKNALSMHNYNCAVRYLADICCELKALCFGVHETAQSLFAQRRNNRISFGYSLALQCINTKIFQHTIYALFSVFSYIVDFMYFFLTMHFLTRANNATRYTRPTGSMPMARMQ